MTFRTGPKRKRSIYFPENIVNEIEAEAERQGRSFSWIVSRAWILSRETMKKLPTLPNEKGDLDG